MSLKTPVRILGYTFRGKGALSHSQTPELTTPKLSQASLKAEWDTEKHIALK